MEMDDHKRRRNMVLYVLIAFVVYLVMSQVLFPSMKTGVKVEDVSYSTFVEKLEAKEVSNLEYTQDASSVALYQLEGEKDIAYRTGTGWVMASGPSSANPGRTPRSIFRTKTPAI